MIAGMMVTPTVTAHAEEVEAAIQNLTFTPASGQNMTVNVSVDGNDVQGFNSLPSGSKLTQWTNGHYYLFVSNYVV